MISSRAVSGFRPGPFPLLINNVGNAKLESATISTDLSRLVFQSANPDDKPAKVVFDSKFAGKPFIVYQAPGAPNALVLFLAITMDCASRPGSGQPPKADDAGDCQRNVRFARSEACFG